MLGPQSAYEIETRASSGRFKDLGSLKKLRRKGGCKRERERVRERERDI